MCSTSGGWIFPCDPQFGLKAGRILDLYERRWQGIPLGPREYVLCADEKTSIQARRRRHPSQPPAPGRSQRVEHEYTRAGAWAYIAAWDVHRARVFGRCEVTTGIVPFDRLVAHVMRQEPYRSARRVFWITDNGSSHRGQRAVARLQATWPKLLRFQQHYIHAAKPFQWTFTRRDLIALLAKLGRRPARAAA